MSAPLARVATPSARLVACFVLVAAAATAPLAKASLAVALATALMATLVARPRYRALARPFGAALLATIALLVPLLVAGRPIDAARLGARAFAAVVIALAFASTLKVHELAGALSALGFPNALTSVVATMLRQLGAVRNQGKTLLLARRLRGASGLSLGGEVLASLFVRTAERAERAELATRLRGHELASAGRRAGLRLSDLPLLTCAAGLAAALHLAAYLA